MLKDDPRISSSLEKLINSIKDSEIYHNYVEASEAVSKVPGLQERIDEYRRNNFLIQQNHEGESCCKKWKILNLTQQLSEQNHWWINICVRNVIL